MASHLASERKPSAFMELMQLNHSETRQKCHREVNHEPYNTTPITVRQLSETVAWKHNQNIVK